MNITRILLGTTQRQRSSSYEIAAVWFPTSIIFLSNTWAHHETILFAFWCALTALYAVRWPIATIRRLAHLGMSRLWILPVVIPILLLAAASFERQRILTIVAILLSLAVQAPLMFLSPRIGPATTENTDSNEPQA